MLKLVLGRRTEFLRRKMNIINKTSITIAKIAPIAPPAIAGAELPLDPGIAVVVEVVWIICIDEEGAEDEDFVVETIVDVFSVISVEVDVFIDVTDSDADALVNSTDRDVLDVAFEA